MRCVLYIYTGRRGIRTLSCLIVLTDMVGALEVAKSLEPQDTVANSILTTYSWETPTNSSEDMAGQPTLWLPQEERLQPPSAWRFHYRCKRKKEDFHVAVKGE